MIFSKGKLYCCRREQNFACPLDRRFPFLTVDCLEKKCKAEFLLGECPSSCEFRLEAYMEGGCKYYARKGCQLHIRMRKEK